MIGRKLIIAVGSAAAAGILSATLVFASGVSATASGGSQPGASYGVSMDGVGTTSGSFSVTLPGLPDSDAIVADAKSQADAAADAAQSQAEAAADKAQKEADAWSDAAQKEARDDQKKAESAVDQVEKQVQDGVADGKDLVTKTVSGANTAVQKTQGQVTDAIGDGGAAVSGAVAKVTNTAGQPSVTASGWSASGNLSGEQVTAPTVTVSNGTDSLTIGGSGSISNPGVPTLP